MITLDNITFKYKKKTVFDNFSLTIEKGSICGLLGKNGAGKSTLLYLLTGLLLPQKGKVEYKGQDISKRKPSSLSDIFIVPEEFELPNISLKKYIKINKGFYPEFSDELLSKNLDHFDMTSDLDLGALSMGQKKKVFMSFALATNTSLLIMDEPTNGLDIPSKSEFRKFIASGMNDDKTILISTHQVQDVDKLLEHIIILDNNVVLLNHSASIITQKLRFVESRDESMIGKSLFSTPSLQGHNLILENKEDDETPLNLEILFNATLKNRDKILSILH